MSDSRSEQSVHESLAPLTSPRSRRAFLQGTLAAGLAVAGTGLLPGATHAAGLTPADGDSDDSIKTIFSIARTAERLAITFYSNGIKNANALHLDGDDLEILKAALIEEQIHELFFAANGGVPLRSTFSFPHADDTFEDLGLFIATQQQLEGAFDSAFIAAVEEFALLGRADLARTACQIAMIESEHRALGRDIADEHGIRGYDIPDNWAFAPKLVEAVGDAPAVLAAAGYLSPRAGNSFTYGQADFSDPSLAPVYAMIEYKTPFAQPEDGEDGEDIS